MKIIRDKSEYKLTEEELKRAYQEYNLKLKMREIKEILNSYPIKFTDIDLAVIATDFIKTYNPEINTKKQNRLKNQCVFDLAEKRKNEIFDSLISFKKVKYSETKKDIKKIFDKSINERQKKSLPPITADMMMQYAIREYKANIDIAL